MFDDATVRSRLGNSLIVVAVLSAMLFLPSSGAAAVPIAGTNVLYTSDADFDQGTLVNVNHDAPNTGQLQLNETTSTFPFIWVALSQRCTIAKINTQTGSILGEYRTIADDASCAESSRTTVALDGSVWVGHRGPGGVTHVGLAELNQCVDRNSNGTIETSTAYGDVKAWTGAVSTVANAQDECIIHHVDTDSLGMFDSRHMSIDADNKLWVGDFSGGSQFVRVNGTTGAVETAPRSFVCGGYGGLIDSDGVIWSANGGSSGLLRWDPDAPDSPTNPRCIDIPVYGLAIDPNGFVWVNELGTNVRKVSPDGNTILGPFPNGAHLSTGASQGLAVAANGDVWISSGLFCSSDCTIGHLKNDGTFVGNVPTPTGSGSTGISVDAAGKVWAANRNSNTATRIDPSAGPIGADGVTPVGAVDLTVDFPAGPDGRPQPFPYNYSDMTGAQLLTSVSQGSWTVTQDGGTAGTEWGTITWNAEAAGNVPAGASIKVEARTAETEAGLGSATFAEVTSGTAFSMVGRFIQVRVTLTSNVQDQSPVLSDIRIRANDVPETQTLTVTKDGTGTGSVDSSPAGITCGADCSQTYDAGTMVTLTATPDANSTFTGWGGDGASCGSATTCQVTMDAAKAVSATFTLIPPQTFELSVTKDGTGTGSVDSSPAGITCGADCSQTYDAGTMVTLTATPDANSTFTGWGGDGASCGSATTCQVTMDTAKAVTASFTRTAAGCTSTIGYWKNHPDAVAPLLPLWLGTPGGSASIEVTTSTQATRLLHKSGSQNGIVSLRAQLLGAKLNIASGADGSVVSTVISDADGFLASNDESAWNALSKATKRQVREWAEVLDQFNKGVIGPGHCSDR